MKIIGSWEFHMCSNFEADILWKFLATSTSCFIRFPVFYCVPSINTFLITFALGSTVVELPRKILNKHFSKACYKSYVSR
jgi:hypothetical protein